MKAGTRILVMEHAPWRVVLESFVSSIAGFAQDRLCLHEQCLSAAYLASKCSLQQHGLLYPPLSGYQGQLLCAVSVLW